ncbi:MAG: hypothetical protein WCT85_07025 [Parachlamydiales bacterium]|jgi:hypothetical protein
MSRFFLYIVFLFYFAKLSALAIGNPSDPGLYHDGVISSCRKNFSIRASYLNDHIYKSKFEDKFKNLSSTPSDIQMNIYAGIITFNFYNYLDIYAIAGSTNLQIDNQIFTNRRFAWGAGFKTIFMKFNNIDFTFDGKYFSTIQKPQYFVVEEKIYPLATSFEQHLEEFQGSIGISYVSNYLIPYIGTTYLYSTITPNPAAGLLILPGGDTTYFDTSTSIAKKRWGLALGMSVINKKKQATLTLETRMYNQNALSFLGTLRF